MNSLEADAIKQYMVALSATCAEMKDSMKKVQEHLEALDNKVTRLEAATNDIRRVITGAVLPTSSSSASPIEYIDISHAVHANRFPMDLLTAKKLDAPAFYVRWHADNLVNAHTEPATKERRMQAKYRRFIGYLNRFLKPGDQYEPVPIGDVGSPSYNAWQSNMLLLGKALVARAIELCDSLRPDKKRPLKEMVGGLYERLDTLPKDAFPGSNGDEPALDLVENEV